MPFDVGATYTSPQAPLAGPEAAARLRVSLQAGPVCLLPRKLPPAIVTALDALAADRLPTLDVSGAFARVRQGVDAAMAGAASEAGEDAAALFAWLRDDMLALATLYAGATRAARLRLRLQAVRDDMCRWFHVDEVAFRLMSTYRGPGTEWIAPRVLATAAPGQPVAVDAIRRLERGTVAILRGARAATPDRPGVLHRSPPLGGSGQARLFLAINEVGA